MGFGYLSKPDPPLRGANVNGPKHRRNFAGCDSAQEVLTQHPGRVCELCNSRLVSWVSCGVVTCFAVRGETYDGTPAKFTGVSHVVYDTNAVAFFTKPHACEECDLRRYAGKVRGFDGVSLCSQLHGMTALTVTT